MARQPSTETLLRTAKSEAKQLRYELGDARIALAAQFRRSVHYEEILSAIAAGKYPEGQASLAARHALDAMKGAR